jgi:hypothetical protein
MSKIAPIAAINPIILSGVIFSRNILKPIIDVSKTTDTLVIARTAELFQPVEL